MFVSNFVLTSSSTDDIFPPNYLASDPATKYSNELVTPRPETRKGI